MIDCNYHLDNIIGKKKKEKNQETGKNQKKKKN